MPRSCKNGRAVPLHICLKKTCAPMMLDVCHPEQQQLAPTKYTLAVRQK